MSKLDTKPHKFSLFYYNRDISEVRYWIGLINDMYAESRNDDCKYAELATQEDFDRFQKFIEICGTF